MHRLWVGCVLAVGLADAAPAEPGRPVAIRWWGQGMVSIETWWNLGVVIDPLPAETGYDVPSIRGDLVLVTHEHFDHTNFGAVTGRPVVVRGLTGEGLVDETHHVLDRPPGDASPTWRPNTKADTATTTPNAVAVRSIAAWHDDRLGAERGATAMFRVSVDGVSIVHAGDLGQTKLFEEQVRQIGRVDVLCLPVGGVYTIDGAQAVRIIEQLKPRYVVPLHYKTDRLKIGLESIDKLLTALGDRYAVDRPTGNTLAVSAADSDDETSTRVVVLGYEPWRPAEELARRMQRMESAAEASREVFIPLTAEQLNWRPPNGSHTARWNAEHLLGRQLGFFSQIYAAVDPEITAIDLNPAQMPPDYKPAHPEWNGAEQARQMRRSAAFVRRFAYLLDGVDLDKRAPGSRWTLRRLLLQMERHFNEHTANVQKKFELPGWPHG